MKIKQEKEITDDSKTLKPSLSAQPTEGDVALVIKHQI